MKRPSKWIQRDRYGIMRSAAIMCALVLLFLFVYLNSQIGQNYTSEKERASYAVRMVSEALELTIQDAKAELKNTADLLCDGTTSEDVLLDALLLHNKFKDVAILRNGSYCRSNGSIEPLSANSENKLQLSQEMSNGETLTVWLDPTAVDDVFSAVNSGEYEYAIFDIDTGDFLLNATSIEASSYYDALAELNVNGEASELLNKTIAQARLESYNGKDGVFYLAHRRTGSLPWGVAIIIPDVLLQQSVDFGYSDILFACLVALLMICIVILNAVLAQRRVRISNLNTVRALNVNEEMLKNAASEAGITVFLYNRSWDRMIYCYDGLCLLNSTVESSPMCSMKTLADSCGIDEQDQESILEKMTSIGVGESTHVKVHCFTHSPEERHLRFALHASADDAKSVFCTVIDATHKQSFEERADMENDYMASVLNKVIAIRQVDISHNRWRLQYTCTKNDLISNKPGWRDYTEDLNNIIREIVHPADYGAHSSCMQLDDLIKAFREGRTEFSFDYRVRGSKNEQYVWHRMRVRIWLDIRTNNLTANLYTFNVDAKKNAELERDERKRILNQSLTALGGMYFGLYYVDLENDLSYTGRSMGRELVDQLCLPYKATFDEYINTVVHPDDREAMKKMLSAYFLRKSMTEGSHFQQMEYRRHVGDGEYRRSAIIVQPARFENGTIKEVALAVRDLELDSESN